MTKSRLIFIAVAAFLACAVLVAHYVMTSATLFVFNRSTVAVSTLKVSVCKDSYDLRGIAPGLSVMLAHRVPGDCHYSLTATFADGKVLTGDYGYITNGMGQTTRIDIRADREAFEGTK